MTLTPATHRASFAIGDEGAAKHVVDLLTEIFFEDQAAFAAFERPDGRWDVTVHFADAPDQALLRELVGQAAGEEIARTITFDTVEAKDWVKASLEDLVPVADLLHVRAGYPFVLSGRPVDAALSGLSDCDGSTRRAPQATGRDPEGGAAGGGAGPRCAGRRHRRRPVPHRRRRRLARAGRRPGLRVLRRARPVPQGFVE